MRNTYTRHQMLWGALIVTLAVALAACAPGGSHSPTSPGNTGGVSSTSAVTSTSTPENTGSTASTQGTLSGLVVAGPTCPVASAEDPCPPKPVPNRQVLIEMPDGKVLATTTTDAAGHFSVALAPGNYLVQVAPDGSLGFERKEPVSVELVAGQVTSVTIELDTGIR